MNEKEKRYLLCNTLFSKVAKIQKSVFDFRCWDIDEDELVTKIIYCYDNMLSLLDDDSESKEADKLVAEGHSYHCAARQIWGDGICECKLGKSLEEDADREMIGEDSEFDLGPIGNK